jgi:hypothetical protein
MEAQKDLKKKPEDDLEFLRAMELMEKMEMLQMMDEFQLDSPKATRNKGTGNGALRGDKK